MNHYRTEHPPNGNNKFNLTLTIKLICKKGYLHSFLIRVWSIRPLVDFLNSTPQRHVPPSLTVGGNGQMVESPYPLP